MDALAREAVGAAVVEDVVPIEDLDQQDRLYSGGESIVLFDGVEEFEYRSCAVVVVVPPKTKW